MKDRPSIVLWLYALTVYTFLYLPIAAVGALSVNDSGILGWPFRGFTLRWYWLAAANEEIVRSLVNSLLLGVLTAVVATTLAVMLGMGLRRGFKGRALVLDLVLLPLLTPAVVSGVLLLITAGMLGLELRLWTTAFIAHVGWALPFAYLALQPRFVRFDRSIEDAARDLGASNRIVFWRIIFPIIRPGVIAAALFSFSLSFDEFIRTLLLAGVDRTMPLQFWVMILEEMSPELSAVAVIIIVISIAASVAGSALSQRGLSKPSN